MLAQIRYSASAFAKAAALSGAIPFDAIEAPLWDAEGIWYRSDLGPLVIRLETPCFIVAKLQNARPLWQIMLAERQAVRRATLVAAISGAIGLEVSHVYGIEPTRVRLAPLGVPIPAEDGNSKRSACVNLLYVGRLEKRKGTEVLLRAIPKILSALPNTRVVFAGRDIPQAPGGVTYQTLASQILGPAHLQRITFMGFVPSAQLSELYRECDVFVAPSLYESFGLIYLEAMAHGKPVVGTTAGGIPEVVAADRTGLLVSPGDHEALADAVIRLLRDPALRRRLGDAARQHVIKNFTVARMVERTVEIYQEARELWKNRSYAHR